MAQSGFTPVQLYRSATPGAVPTAANLAPGELALNTADQKLFFENASGVVVSIDTANGTVTSVNASGGTTGLTFSGGPITTSGTLTLAGTLAVANGGTGATTLTGVVKGTGTAALTAGTVALASEVSGTLPVANGGTGVTSSTGTVAVVLSNSPTLVTPNLGTPSAATLTNATGLPLSTGVTGTLAVANGGTGVTTSTGTTSVVLSNSPVLVTPTLGAASATSIANGLGAVGTPSYTFTGDLNTGMWSPAADTIAFSEGGVEAMRITSAGDVGIGTSSPGAKLDVSSSTFNIVASRSTGGYAAFQRFAPSGQQAYDFYTINGVEAGRITVDGSNFMAFATGSAAAERMRIDSSGNVGIGTSSPTYRLDIVSGDTTASVGYAMRLRSNATATAASLQFTNSAGSAQNGLIRCTDTGETVIQADGASSLLAFRTNGDERMRITSAGNVGIGTSAPSFKLQVNGFVGVTDGTSTVRLANSGGVGLVSTVTNHPLAFQTNDTERMRITSGGDVGIGTSSPGTKLDVSSSTFNIVASRSTGGYAAFQRSAPTGQQAYDFYTINGVEAGRITVDGSNFMAFATGSAAAERMRIDSSGNVGIGTTSPAQRLHVRQDQDGTTAALIQNRNGSGTPISAIQFISGAFDLSDNRYAMISSAGGPNTTLQFWTGEGAAPAERMRIDSSGNVGIGTTPSFKLQVDAASGANQVAYFVNTSAGSTLAGIAASIESGGNNTNSYHFAGVTQTVALWYLYGNGTTSYTSDIRVKKNVTTTRDGYLEDVCKLRVVKYNWYNDSDDTPRELGFIAQEVEQVFPGLVQDALHPTKDGEIHKVLKGSVMMPIMLKALQEASAKIDALTARVAQLEGN